MEVARLKDVLFRRLFFFPEYSWPHSLPGLRSRSYWFLNSSPHSPSSLGATPPHGPSFQNLLSRPRLLSGAMVLRLKTPKNHLESPQPRLVIAGSPLGPWNLHLVALGWWPQIPITEATSLRPIRGEPVSGNRPVVALLEPVDIPCAPPAPAAVGVGRAPAAAPTAQRRLQQSPGPRPLSRGADS